MKTNRFIREYLADEARITIAHTNGDIWYEGDVKSFPRMMTIGTDLVASPWANSSTSSSQ